MGTSLGFAERKEIPIGNAWVAREEVRYFSEIDNAWVAWHGEDLRVRFSIYPTGYDTDGYPSTLFGPYEMVEGSIGGWFAVAISGDDVTLALTDRVGQTIYQIVEGSYGSSYYNLATVQPLLVIDPRPVLTV